MQDPSFPSSSRPGSERDGGSEVFSVPGRGSEAPSGLLDSNRSKSSLFSTPKSILKRSPAFSGGSVTGDDTVPRHIGNSGVKQPLTVDTSANDDTSGDAAQQAYASKLASLLAKASSRGHIGTVGGALFSPAAGHTPTSVSFPPTSTDANAMSGLSSGAEPKQVSARSRGSGSADVSLASRRSGTESYYSFN